MTDIDQEIKNGVNTLIALLDRLDGDKVTEDAKIMLDDFRSKYGVSYQHLRYEVLRLVSKAFYIFPNLGYYGFERPELLCWSLVPCDEHGREMRLDVYVKLCRDDGTGVCLTLRLKSDNAFTLEDFTRELRRVCEINGYSV